MAWVLWPRSLSKLWRQRSERSVAAPQRCLERLETSRFDEEVKGDKSETPRRFKWRMSIQIRVELSAPRKYFSCFFDIVSRSIRRNRSRLVSSFFFASSFNAEFKAQDRPALPAPNSMIVVFLKQLIMLSCSRSKEIIPSCCLRCRSAENFTYIPPCSWEDGVETDVDDVFFSYAFTEPMYFPDSSGM